MTSTTSKQDKIVKVLLICGFVIPIYYISIDAVCAMSYGGYRYFDMAISELSAIGSPTASLWKILVILYNPLLFFFGLGIIRSASSKKSLRIAGYIMSISAILGYGWKFFPMNMRGNIGSASDTGHLAMAGLTVLMMTLFIAFGSGADGKKFRIYSIFTIAVMFGFGFYVGTQAPRVAAQLPTPGMGIIERISVFSPMIWMLVLSVVLLRIDKN
jgi:hypothetical protein